MIDIKFTPIDLKAQRVKKVREAYLRLHENSLEYKIDMLAYEPNNVEDPMLGESVIRTSLHSFLKKECIESIEKSYISHLPCWILIINSPASEIKIYYLEEDEETIDLVIKQLNQWLDF